MADNPNETWAIMASRHGPKRFVQPSKRSMENKADIPLVGSILFEDDNFKGQFLVNKAIAIIQQSLSSGSVLFSFQKTLFADRVDAYKLIQEQISPEVEFRPISLYAERDDGFLLIEAKFTDADHTKQAIVEGLTVQGVVYKASSTRESTEYGELKHVQFTLLPRMVDQDTFLHDLMESLSYYGKVLQIKKYTHQGFFEGKLSMIIDTSVGYQVGQAKWQEAKPLEPMIYLSKFDISVPAMYKDTSVCNFCFKSGHLRSKCPEFGNRKCFGCNKFGHMLRACPETKQFNGHKLSLISSLK